MKGDELKHFIAFNFDYDSIDDVTKDKIDEAKEMFDSNKDGEISKDEVLAFFQKLPAKKLEVAAEKLIKYAYNQKWEPVKQAAPDNEYHDDAATKMPKKVSFTVMTHQTKAMKPEKKKKKKKIKKLTAMLSGIKPPTYRKKCKCCKNCPDSLWG